MERPKKQPGQTCRLLGMCNDLPEDFLNSTCEKWELNPVKAPKVYKVSRKRGTTLVWINARTKEPVVFPTEKRELTRNEKETARKFREAERSAFHRFAVVEIVKTEKYPAIDVTVKRNLG